MELEVKKKIERRFLIPEFKGSVYERWSFNFIQRNYWRVSEQIGDQEDCLAQAAYIFVVCRKRYGKTVNSAKHFMYLYQLYLRMEFNTYALKDGHRREGIKQLKDKQVERYAVCEGDIGLKLSRASKELKEVLGILFDAPNEILQILRQDTKSLAMKQVRQTLAKSNKLSEELERLLE